MIIIGEIGSGKSSLLSAMLGQLLYLPKHELDKDIFTDPEKEANNEEVEALMDRLYNLPSPQEKE